MWGRWGHGGSDGERRTWGRCGHDMETLLGRGVWGRGVTDEGGGHGDTGDMGTLMGRGVWGDGGTDGERGTWGRGGRGDSAGERGSWGQCWREKGTRTWRRCWRHGNTDGEAGMGIWGQGMGTLGALMERGEHGDMGTWGHLWGEQGVGKLGAVGTWGHCWRKRDMETWKYGG